MTEFEAQQRAMAWYPRACEKLGGKLAGLEREHLPTAEGGYLARCWAWAESSARLCDGCESLDDCRQHRNPGLGSDSAGFVRVVILGLRLTTGLRPCAYKRLADEAEARPWVEKRHAEKTLAGYQVNEANRPAFTACRKYLRNLEKNLETGRGITLSGPTGVGKTHLASAVFHRVVLEAGCSGAFLHVPGYVGEIKARFGERGIDNGSEAYLEATLSARFVVLDNLEFRQVTDWLIDTLNRIVDFRYRLMLPTLVTSGWGPEKMAEQLEAKLPSRLAEMGEWFHIKDADWRRRKARKGGSSCRRQKSAGEK